MLRRVRGLGMPRRKVGGAGDLLVRFAVRFPREPLSGEASRRALKQILPRSAAASHAAPPAGQRLYRLEAVAEADARPGEDDDDGGWGV